MNAAALADLYHPLSEDVLMTGDRKADKAQVAYLIGQVDELRAIDCGKLEMLRIIEQLTPLLIGVNLR